MAADNKLDFDFPSNNPIVEVKPANMVWLQWFQRIQSIVGVRQVWTTVTGTRALGTTYVNGTGRPIKVSVRATLSGAGSLIVTFANGVLLAGAYQASIGNNAAIYFEVPNGDSYTVTPNAGTGTLSLWVELR